MCTILTLGSQSFALQPRYTNNPQQLIYWDTNTSSTDTLVVLYSVPVLTSPSRNISSSSADLSGCTIASNGLQPVGCVATFATQGWSLPLGCSNDALYSDNAHVDVQGFYVEAITSFIAQISTF
jgi:hypothetical protein